MVGIEGGTDLYMGQIDCSSIPPDQRPQIGERVKTISGPRQGYEGTVVGYKDKKTEMKRREIIVRLLTDENLMWKIIID